MGFPDEERSVDRNGLAKKENRMVPQNPVWFSLQAGKQPEFFFSEPPRGRCEGCFTIKFQKRFIKTIFFPFFFKKIFSHKSLS
jgi:hypothetical protein